VLKHYTVSDGELVLFLWPAEEGGYDVTSPLDPELITQAESVEEAFVMARDVLELLTEAQPSKRHRAHYTAEAQRGHQGTEPPPKQVKDEALPPSEAQKQDLACRLNLYKKTPTRCSSWNEVKARLDDRCLSKEKSET
jgi:antitoxin HicB